MEKFAVNYNSLEGTLAPQERQIYRYQDVKHRLRRVAYDIVRFVDGDDISGLWQVQQTDSGDVIVAKYDDVSNYATGYDESVEKTAAVNSDWKAYSDKSGSVHIFYKDSPVTKITLASIGIPDGDVDIVCNYLPEKLATNEALTSNLLAEMPAANRNELVRSHPELAVVAGISVK